MYRQDGLLEAVKKKLEADFKKLNTKISRFPRGLRGIGGDNDRYIAPSVVAIGPYHHGAPHLQEMEEVKRAAAYQLCRDSGHSTEEVYQRVYSVVEEARGCYDEHEMDGDHFADMMFLDGCFLLQYLVLGDAIPELQNRMMLSPGPSIQRDIFLLENQIPWLVLESLMEFVSVDVLHFVDEMANKFFFPGRKPRAKKCQKRMRWGCIPAPNEREGGGRGGMSDNHYTPPHLLGLLRFSQVGNMPSRWEQFGSCFAPSTLCSSAVELAQIGVRLAPSTEEWYWEMSVRRRHLFAELSLSPVFLNDVTACWLVNMAALEASTSASSVSDGYIVSSYLSVLAMLMDREEDVHQLRAKEVMYSTFSNKQTLGFFKGLAQNLRLGTRYYLTLEVINSYKRHRRCLIFIHRLLYNSFHAMTVASLLSIFGVLVGIFKTLLSNKKQ